MVQKQRKWQQSGQLTALAETSADAIIVSNASDTILTWNKSAERLFGHGQEVVGKPLTTIVPNQYRQRHQAGLHRYLETGERHILGQTVELEALHANGAVFPIELSLSTWEEDGQTFFGAIIRDISERKHMERMREDVYQLMRHDLKSPLIGITGYAQRLLKENGLDERQIGIAKSIEELGKQTLDLIHQTHSLYLMEMGTYEVEQTPVDLAEQLEQLPDLLDPLLGRRGITLEIELRQKPPTTGNKSLINSMLENLIKNAIEASPDNGTVHVALDMGNMGNQKPAAMVMIHNQGEVPEEIRDHFFDPYVTSSKKAGFGLGTYSARLIAEAHGGDINFTSSPESGTQVAVRLPVDSNNFKHQ